jgi:ABC-type oligopeptide transport system ATPase subunit
MVEPLLATQDLRIAFRPRRSSLLVRGEPFVAVDGVSLAVSGGEAFGIVGESGSGKTTLLRSMIRLVEPSSGTISFAGKDVTRLQGRELQDYLRHVHVIFQNPYNAFHPRMTIAESLSEPLRIHHIGKPNEDRERIADALRQVGMDPNFISRYPRQFSGGQLQRLGLARALVLGADVLLADEPVSALDVSIQAQVLNLFQDLKERLGLTYIVIAHDLAAVRYLCDRVAVMYRGRFVEVGRTEDLYARPAHPYTQALLSAIPTIRRGVAGEQLAEVDAASLVLGRGELREIEPGHFVEAA